MPVEINLDNDEDIIRVYTRYPKQVRIFNRLSEGDFARIMLKGNGISIWRLKYCTREEAKEALKVPYKLKGTAIIKAKLLKDLGIRFVGDSQTAAHIAARCDGCDMQLRKVVRCKKNDGSECGLDSDYEISLSKTLANPQYFKIDQPIVLPPE